MSDISSLYQPIESAPKDETWILLYGEWLDEPKVESAYWSDNGGDPGWFDSELANHELTVFGWKPTHWLPLILPDGSVP